MEISKLNQKIVFQKLSCFTDEVGNVIESWNDFYSCFSSVDTTVGTEKQRGDTEERYSIRFSVRFCKKLSELSSTEYRIVFCKRVYNITEVDFDNYSGKAIKIKAVSEKKNGSICAENE